MTDDPSGAVEISITMEEMVSLICYLVFISTLGTHWGKGERITTK